MEQKKGLSVKVDETIENFLQFLGRYAFTVSSIIRHPLSPEKLLNDYEQTPHAYVRPLTFLTIGAFCFSLLISVFPEGIRALPYILFETANVKGLIKDRWKDAFSVTTLFTTGLPTILTIVLLSRVSGKFLYKDPARRLKWFHLNCYVFGGQMISIFTIFFLDTVVDSVLILIPTLSKIQLTDQVLSWLGLSLILSMVGVAVICPLVALVAGNVKLGRVLQLRSGNTKPVFYAVSYFLLVFYTYPAVASLLPSLESKYFPKPKPEGRIIGYSAEQYFLNKELYSFEFSILIDNPSSEDFPIEIEPYYIEFHWGISEKEPDEVWELNSSKALLKEPLSKTNIAIVPKNTKLQMLIKMEDVPLSVIYCEASSLAKNQNDANGEGPLNTFNLHVKLDGIKETFLIDLEDFFALDFFEAEEISKRCSKVR